MKFLKATHDTKKKTVKQMLHEAMAHTDKPRPLTKIHASSVTDQKREWCPREVAILLDQGMPGNAMRIDTALRYTFDEGLDKQKRFNEDWLVDSMVGLWRCPHCGDLSRFGKKPAGCLKCDHPNPKWDYVEARFEHEFTKMLGSVDAFLDMDEPLLTVIECKIIKGDDFKKLAAPMAEHRVRTQLYLRLIEESNAPEETKAKIDTSYARVIYMMRGHGAKDEAGAISPFKEFVVERNDDTTRRYFAKAAALTESRRTTEENDPKYPAGICADMFCARAGSCKVAKACFSGKYAQDITWVGLKGEVVHGGANIIATDKTITTG